jgi:hypothetical protein
LSIRPPEQAGRGELPLASKHSGTENKPSPVGQATLFRSAGTSVLPEDEIHNKSNQKEEENITDMANDLNDGLCDHHRESDGSTPCELWRTTQSDITSM